MGCRNFAVLDGPPSTEPLRGVAIPHQEACTIGIVQQQDDLIGVDVRVVVWHWDHEQVVVELVGHEQADHKVACLEHLMDRWQLVHMPSDELKVSNVELEWPEVAVPPDEVKRVVPVVIRHHKVGSHLSNTPTT